MSGEIENGDYEKFRAFLVKNLERYKESRTISLSSNGGNLIETLKIAKLLRSAYPTILVDNGKCASSCFFLYLNGKARLALPESLGIHRAYFDKTYFAGLKPDVARSQQALLTATVNTILDESGVPLYLKDIMNRTSSEDIYWLSAEDIKNLGMFPTWYEELRIANCGKYMEQLKRAKENLPDDGLTDAERYFLSKSESDLNKLEQKFEAEQNLMNCESKIIDKDLPELVKALAAEEKSATKATTSKQKAHAQ